MKNQTRRHALIASLSALALGFGLVQAAPSALADTFTGIPGHAANGTYGFDANPDPTADPFFEEQQIATAGDKYDCYRIPALNTTKDGDVLASYDGRPANCGDAPYPNAIVQNRSTDNGKTWSAQIDIAPATLGDKPVGYSDPSYIVDRETGTIFNFHVKSFDAGIIASKPGTDPSDRNIIHAAYAKSTDGGRTWIYDRVITRDITPDPSWKARFATSGNGIQLQYGRHKGRLIQPAMVITNGNYWKAVAWLSDDHGETWYASRPWGNGMDENKIVELSNGVLMNNSRSSYGSERARKISYSYDGGYTWTEPELDNNLPDPRNNASIIRAFPNAPKDSALAKVLLFSNTASTRARANGTIRMSCDDGQTWPVSREFKRENIMYTNLTTLANGDIGILWEDNAPGGNNIYYGRFNLPWLGASCLNVDSPTKSVGAGDNITVPVTLTNTTGVEIFNQAVNFEGPAGWTFTSTPSRISLQPGESTTVEVKAVAPLEGNNGLNEVKITVANGPINSIGTFELLLRDATEVEVPGPGEYWDFNVTEPTAWAALTYPRENNEWKVGELVNYEFAIVNPYYETAAIKVEPSGGEGLNNFARPSARTCRYSSLNIIGTKCPLPTHTVTAEDLERGYFETEVTFEYTNLETNEVTTQTLTTPRITVVPGSIIEPNPRLETVRATILPVGELASTTGDITVPVTVHATSSTGTIPDGTAIELYLNDELVSESPLADGHATFSVTVASVEPSEEAVTYSLRARPKVTADDMRGVDGTGSFSVLPRDREMKNTSITLGELADLPVGSVKDNRILVSAKVQHNGEDAADEEVTFSSSGSTASVRTNSEGVALTYLTIAELGQLITENTRVEVTAAVAARDTASANYEAAETTGSFLVTPKDVQEEPASVDWGAILGGIATVIALISAVFAAFAANLF
ncbi:exo-alpha-sialidase [Corynebacterium sp. ES2715-CONJ3]|uniref:exo-alpha-sialidase n=1 Tax=Corynebacterium sp. ES2715-CONJ3 TaxID=2974028 RepID=UPI00216AAE7C|nr:exo-alpha-sialidase [Corynebacterium sp. ES2715-CONJ3]MCS4492410.1 exo-alpha-sialidase [Corynebacterium sp. ES2715-CONJ3]